MNLWRELPAGPDVPQIVNVIVAIPSGARNKFKYDTLTGAIVLDRVLSSPLHYPGDYGVIPQTLAAEDDPLDILVMIHEPTFSGCVMRARPIGVFRMIDRGKSDDKILAVPLSDPIAQDYHNLADIPQHFLKEMAHFFEVYKDLEGGHTQALGWEDAERAKARITEAIGLYHKRFG